MINSRQKIITAAIALFNSSAAFNLEDAAIQAGVSRRTLHRHFSGKEELLQACKETAMAACNTAMIKAYDSSDYKLKKLEAMLYAVIDSGSNSVFIKRYYQRSSYVESGGNDNFNGNDVKSKWFRIVEELQQNEIISRQLTIAWIFNFFGSVADAAILAVDNGDVARNDAGRFAWFSFSNGIGLQSK